MKIILDCYLIKIFVKIFWIYSFFVEISLLEICEMEWFRIDTRFPRVLLKESLHHRYNINIFGFREYETVCYSPNIFIWSVMDGSLKIVKYWKCQNWINLLQFFTIIWINRDFVNMFGLNIIALCLIFLNMMSKDWKNQSFGFIECLHWIDICGWPWFPGVYQMIFKVFFRSRSEIRMCMRGKVI
jgi:hypothetical protein